MSQESNNTYHRTNIKRILSERMQSLKKLIIQQRSARLLVPLVLLSILAGVTIAQLTSQQGVASSGTIKVIGVSLFWDKACTNKVTSITWGLITPGTTTNRYVYVRNDGTATGTLLMEYGNWTPTTAASYFTLTWNCTNHALSRNAVVCAKFTLAAQLSIVGVTEFNFKILVQAVG